MRVPGDQPKLLTIEANDCQIFRGQVKSGWSSALSLAGCDLRVAASRSGSAPLQRRLAETGAGGASPCRASRCADRSLWTRPAAHVRSVRLQPDFTWSA